MIEPLLLAAWVGFGIAAPVGPIGLLVIQRTLRHGPALGLATGRGAAVADACCGAIGVFGGRALLATLQGLRLPLGIVGGALLLWLAWRSWVASNAPSIAAVPRRPADARASSSQTERAPDAGTAPAVPTATTGAGAAAAATATATATATVARPRLFGAFVGTLLLTLSNPTTILSFVAIFGAMSAPFAEDRGAAASPWWMVAGVMAGSALWWLLLCAGVSALRTRFDTAAQQVVGRLSALLLAAFALWQWARLGAAA